VSTATGVRWGALEHAFGRAFDVPVLLEAVSRARGSRLRKPMEQLCERVLHQGTIYSASAPAVHELIAMSARAQTSDKALFYSVLVEFASSARQAVRDGHATPCCSGGEPADGEAILGEIAQARDQFVRDLESSEPEIRAYAGSLLTASGSADADTVQLVRARYSAEADAAVRLTLLESLERVPGAIAAWREFLAAALARETDRHNRRVLRHAEIIEWKADAAPAAVSELVALCVEAEAKSLFTALRALGTKRELDALLETVDGCASHDFLRSIAEHLLRAAFEDQRTGWENISRSIAAEPGEPQPANQDWVGRMFKGILKMLILILLGKLFPSLVRRKIRKAMKAGAKRVRKIEYWGVEGAAPELPVRLRVDQKRALEALANKPEVWFHRTNLWTLFGCRTMRPRCGSSSQRAPEAEWSYALPLARRRVARHTLRAKVSADRSAEGARSAGHDVGGLSSDPRKGLGRSIAGANAQEFSRGARGGGFSRSAVRHHAAQAFRPVWESADRSGGARKSAAVLRRFL
jgi:hypothetical protein